MISVIDTSSALAAAGPLGDGPSRKAGQLRVELAERGPLVAPALIGYEVGNVIFSKHPERYGEDLRERLAAYRLVLTPIELVALDPEQVEQAATLVEEHDLTFYDAASLALASREPTTLLVTEDRRLRRAGQAELGDKRCMDTATAWTRIEDGEL